MKKIFKGSAMLNPVPCSLVTSRNEAGDNNVFTAAWVGIVCTRPPMLSLSIRPERLSYDYICQSKEFIINLPSTDMTRIVDYCGVVSGKKEDKIKKFNFTLKEGNSVNVAYIDECPITIECKVNQIIQLGSHDMFIANIQTVNVDEDLMDNNGKIHFEKADLLCYSHGEYFGLSKKPYGSFGYSIKKKKRKK